MKYAKYVGGSIVQYHYYLWGKVKMEDMMLDLKTFES